MAGPVPCGILYIIGEDYETYVMAEDGTTHIIAEQQARRERICLQSPVETEVELTGELVDCGS